MRQVEFFCVVCDQPYIVVWQPSASYRFVRLPCSRCNGMWTLFPTIDVEGVLRERGLAN